MTKKTTVGAVENEDSTDASLAPQHREKLRQSAGVQSKKGRCWRCGNTTRASALASCNAGPVSAQLVRKLGCSLAHCWQGIK